MDKLQIKKYVNLVCINSYKASKFARTLSNNHRNMVLSTIISGLKVYIISFEIWQSDCFEKCKNHEILPIVSFISRSILKCVHITNSKYDALTKIGTGFMSPFDDEIKEKKERAAGCIERQPSSSQRDHRTVY